MKTIRRKIGAGVFAAGVLFASAGVSQAVTLADMLIPGAFLDVGNLRFFDFSNANATGTINVPFDMIDVVPHVISTNEVGIGFQTGLWNLAGPNQTYDLKFDFSVKTLKPNDRIIGNALRITGSGDEGGKSLIAEVVTDTANNFVANQLVWLNVNNTNKVYDADSYDPGFGELQIHKDFAMNTTLQGSGDVIFVSHFDQTFKTIPEPATNLVGVLIASGLLIRRRSRRI